MANEEIKLRDLTHKLQLCSAKDVVSSNKTLDISRNIVFEAWAKIKNYTPSAYGSDGFTVNDKTNSITHKIYIRNRPNFSISVSAWAYELRLKSAPRWYRIISVQDYGNDLRWLCLKCHLHEESDYAQEPLRVSPAKTELPQGFKF